MLSMKQDIERTRQRRIERELQLKQQQQNFRPNLEEWAKRTQQNNSVHNNQLEAQEERLRQLKLEENRRHQELEAAQMEEERLIREARRRQDEELRFRGFVPKGHQMPNHVNNSPIEIPPPLPKSPPPLEAPQRLDRLLMTTSSAYQSVPEPKTDLTLDHSSKYPSALRNGDLSEPLSQHTNHTPKKVSWNDNPSTTDQMDDDSEHLASDASNHQNSSFTLQDIDEALGNHGDVSGNTPGVIGAQEVYNDPRQRIEAARTAQNAGRQPPMKPEKLSFAEKMRMFAMEAGSDDSPKTKSKISKAQREIE
ncbi:unnamed protein product, partial [Medioppia subpectinata]